MTTEEKLQNFYNHSLDSANREAERVIGDHQKALDKIFEWSLKMQPQDVRQKKKLLPRPRKQNVMSIRHCLRISFISDGSCPVKIWN